MLTLPVFINLILSGIIGLGLLIENHNRSNLKTKLEAEDRVEVATAHTEVQDVEEQKVTSKPASSGTKTEPQVIKCPKCSKHIRITNSTRPLQIACPHCGVKGEIR
jgi:DNA-directed RNA polymerase subunit RPC12/RpoP